MQRHFLIYGGMILWGLVWGPQALVARQVQAPARDTSSLPSADTTKADTTYYGPVTVIVKNPGEKHADIKAVLGHADRSKKSKNVKVSWLGFDLGLNNYVDRTHYGSAEARDFVPGPPKATEDEFSLRTGKSVNVNFWPVWIKVNLVRHYLSLKTGLGVEMNNYRYAKPITYVNDPSGTYIRYDTAKFKKNKLFTEYLTIPILLNLETNPYHDGRSFRVSAGPTVGFLVKSRTKQVSREMGKVKNKDSFNLEKFRLGMRAELGYGPVTLYGAYSFTPIHRNGLDQYPYAIGIVLIGNKGW